MHANCALIEQMSDVLRADTRNCPAAVTVTS